MILTNEDVEQIQYLYGLITKGRYGSIVTITDTYNRVFADRPNFKPRNRTNCGTCLRSMVCEMNNALQKTLWEMEQQENVNETSKEKETDE